MITATEGDDFCECDEGWLRNNLISNINDVITVLIDECIPCMGPGAIVEPGIMSTGFAGTCVCTAADNTTSERL